jgi:hypothetical protein
MNDTQASELAMWDVRCNDLQNSLDRLREDRDELKIELQIVVKELALHRQMVERMRVAMSQGQEL